MRPKNQPKLAWSQFIPKALLSNIEGELLVGNTIEHWSKSKPGLASNKFRGSIGSRRDLGRSPRKVAEEGSELVAVGIPAPSLVIYMGKCNQDSFPNEEGES